MTPRRFERLQRLFLEACEREEGSLDAWIAGECRDDRELGEELLQMLVQHRRSSSPLDGHALDDPGLRTAIAGAGESWLPSIHGYELGREVARGGQSAVYEAVQEATGQRVAIKVLIGLEFSSDEDRKRQDREVRVLAKLSHPNIVGVIDRGRTGSGIDYVVMPFVSGRPLDEHLSSLEQEATSADDAYLLNLFVKIARAVGVAHRAGVVHRDLKPANIFIDEHGEPRVLDFGLARLVPSPTSSEETAQHHMTAKGRFLGSLPWASPEQVAGETSDIRPPTDVYALGVILYQLLTGGRFPYEVVGNVRDVLDNILNAAPKPPSSVGQGSKTKHKLRRDRRRNQLNSQIDAVVLTALAKKPEHRYADADALADDIVSYLQGKEVAAQRHNSLLTKASAPASWRRVRVSAVVGLLSFLLLIAQGVVYWTYKLPDRRALSDAIDSALEATSEADHARSRAEQAERARLEATTATEALIAAAKKAHFAAERAREAVLKSEPRGDATGFGASAQGATDQLISKKDGTSEDVQAVKLLVIDDQGNPISKAVCRLVVGGYPTAGGRPADESVLVEETRSDGRATIKHRGLLSHARHALYISKPGLCGVSRFFNTNTNDLEPIVLRRLLSVQMRYAYQPNDSYSLVGDEVVEGDILLHPTQGGSYHPPARAFFSLARSQRLGSSGLLTRGEPSIVVGQVGGSVFFDDAAGYFSHFTDLGEVDYDSVESVDTDALVRMRERTELREGHVYIYESNIYPPSERTEVTGREVRYAKILVQSIDSQSEMPQVTFELTGLGSGGQIDLVFRPGSQGIDGAESVTAYWAAYDAGGGSLIPPGSGDTDERFPTEARGSRLGDWALGGEHCLTKQMRQSSAGTWECSLPIGEQAETIAITFVDDLGRTCADGIRTYSLK